MLWESFDFILSTQSIHIYHEPLKGAREQVDIKMHF